MKILYKLFILVFATNIFAVTITGNQDKNIITGGTVEITSGGVTQTVRSGEIIFLREGGTPSKPRKVKNSDMKDIYEELPLANVKSINLKYAPLKYKIAKKIRLKLIQKGVDRTSIKIKKHRNLSQLYVKDMQGDSLEALYPYYYKTAQDFFKKKRNKGRVPTVTITLKFIKKYHHNLFNQ
jgi:hypothetical protein